MKKAFTLVFLLLLSPVGVGDDKLNPIAIVIHGGAGTIDKSLMTREKETAYRDKLTDAVEAGYAVLKDGGSSRDAVIAAVVIMEDSPLFNAGHGAVFNHQAEVELDASIMEGLDLNAGAVAGVQRVKNPILLADKVLSASPHVMLMGEGAETFAVSQGFELVDNSYFHTERRLEQLKKVQEKDGLTLSEDDQVDDKKFGTVGAVALDRDGTITAATSTGGMTNKQFGRIGDSPIIGAGTYADNSACGISATGHGEFFIRAAVAHDICARVKYQGISLQKAADEVILERLVEMGGGGGVIGVAPDGDVVMSFNSSGMYRAAINREGVLTVSIFK